MMNIEPHKRISLVFLVGALILLLGAGLMADAQKDQGKKASPAQSKALPGGKDTGQYVGADTCKGCHEDMFRNFESTPHWRTMRDKRPEWQGCEACHGPGGAHVEGGGDKSKIITFKGMSTGQIIERCLNCHQFGEEHSNFARSTHAKNSVSCIDCHSPHHSKERRALLVNRQPQLCYGCHQDKRSEFAKPFRHRVNEGLILCTDCHNQHGGFLTQQLRATAAQDQVCFKCHVDKAGPFAFEHVPVKTEGCVYCHIPHGSNNPRLMRRSQVNLLCLECHTLVVDTTGAPGIPTFHDQSQKYQACTMCHQFIHGSNFSEVFFK
jgi:DmsE family decaheme c-type cytochrome